MNDNTFFKGISLLSFSSNMSEKKNKKLDLIVVDGSNLAGAIKLNSFPKLVVFPIILRFRLDITNYIFLF